MIHIKENVNKSDQIYFYIPNQDSKQVDKCLESTPPTPVSAYGDMESAVCTACCVQCIYTEHGNTGSLCAFFTEIGFLISRVLQF